MKLEVHQHLIRAMELLEVAEEMLGLGYLADSISRSYYAIFHAASAVLMDLGVERRSHHSLWAAFAEYVTRKGLIEEKYHRWGIDAFSARSLSEYIPSPQDTPEDARKNLERAGEFVAACRTLLEKSASSQAPGEG